MRKCSTFTLLLLFYPFRFIHSDEVQFKKSNSEDGEVDEVGSSKESEGSRLESLDYEVIENYAYREEQVCCKVNKCEYVCKLFLLFPFAYEYGFCYLLFCRHREEKCIFGIMWG